MQGLSREPAREVVVVVAHGPVSDDNNNLWLADMGALVERMRPLPNSNASST